MHTLNICVNISNINKEILHLLNQKATTANEMAKTNYKLTKSRNTVKMACYTSAQNSLNSGDGTKESEVSYNQSAHFFGLWGPFVS